MTETLWNVGLEETAPKTDSDWKKFEDAAVGLVDAGKSMLAARLGVEQLLTVCTWNTSATL